MPAGGPPVFRQGQRESLQRPGNVSGPAPVSRFHSSHHCASDSRSWRSLQGMSAWHCIKSPGGTAEWVASPVVPFV